MKGYKTWIAAVACFSLGAVDFYNGDVTAAAEKWAIGVGLIGIGHKVEKGQELPSPTVRRVSADDLKKIIETMQKKVA